MNREDFHSHGSRQSPAAPDSKLVELARQVGDLKNSVAELLAWKATAQADITRVSAVLKPPGALQSWGSDAAGVPGWEADGTC